MDLCYVLTSDRPKKKTGQVWSGLKTGPGAYGGPMEGEPTNGNCGFL